MRQEVEQHLEKVMGEVKGLFTEAITRIEALKLGETLPITRLADTLAKERGLKGTAVYPVLKMLGLIPGFSFKVGARGGYYRLSPEPTAEAMIAAIKEVSEVVNKIEAVVDTDAGR